MRRTENEKEIYFIIETLKVLFGRVSSQSQVSSRSETIARITKQVRDTLDKRKKMENSTNISVDCYNGVPSATEFFAGFQLEQVLLLAVPIALWLMTLTVYVMNLKRTIEHGHKVTKGNVAVLLTIYPVRPRQVNPIEIMILSLIARSLLVLH